MGQKEYTNDKCLHCLNLTMLELVHQYSEVKMHDTEYDEAPWEAGNIYEILKCTSCSKITFRKYFWHEFMEEESDKAEIEILYPMSKKMPLGLPLEIQKGLEAADKVKKIDANAYGVLVRRVLEMICLDRKAKGNSLFDKLKNLAANREIPEKLVDVALHLKNFGNVAAHAELGDLTEAEIPILDDLCRAILEYVYSAPHLASRAENSLKMLKK